MNNKSDYYEPNYLIDCYGHPTNSRPHCTNGDSITVLALTKPNQELIPVCYDPRLDVFSPLYSHSPIEIYYWQYLPEAYPARMLEYLLQKENEQSPDEEL